MPDDAGLSRITGIIRHRRCEGISPLKGVSLNPTSHSHQ